MSRRGSELDAFAGFCAGLVTLVVLWLGLMALGEVVPVGQGFRHAAELVIAVAGFTCMVVVSLALRARAAARGD